MAIFLTSHVFVVLLNPKTKTGIITLLDSRPIAQLLMLQIRFGIIVLKKRTYYEFIPISVRITSN